MVILFYVRSIRRYLSKVDDFALDRKMSILVMFREAISYEIMPRVNFVVSLRNKFLVLTIHFLMLSEISVTSNPIY